MAFPICAYDVDELREKFRTAKPFPFVAIDNFLDEDFARQVAAAYPSYDHALEMGREFASVNEKLKIQISDPERFNPPVAKLNEALASPEFLGDLAEITGIPKLLADAQLRGAGMHLTNASGRLDVHVDFNYFEEENLHRRLNILVYLNPHWDDAWGGRIELWDKDVRRCHHSFAPAMNRCVIFETSEVSFHGVTPLTCPNDQMRRSFAAYYYTHEAPSHWNGQAHSTVFKARPSEVLRGNLLMPAEKARRTLLSGARSIKRKLRDSMRPPGSD